MSERAVRRARAGLVVVAAAVGCNAISGIDDFSASDPSGGSSASGGAAATGGAVATGGDAGTGGSAATAGTEGAAGVAGSAGVAGDAGTAGDAGADVATMERCNGGTDDDADGRVDCFDSDCRDDPACAGFCSDAETLPCNVIRQLQSNSAEGSTSRIGPPLYGCGGRDEPGPEYAYRINVPDGQRAFVELFGLDADMSLYTVSVMPGGQCDATSACVTASASGMGLLAESLSFSRVVDRDDYLIIDGLGAGNYSISVQCSAFDGCVPARAIEAGPQTVTGSLVMGSAPNVTQKLTTYSCGGGGSRGAPEAAFMFTPTANGNYRIDVTELTANADLFVLAAPNCNAVCLNPNSKSNSPSGSSESLVLAATAGTTYYIVIDAYATTPFTLGVTQL